jgi:hypothetical protein
LVAKHQFLFRSHVHHSTQFGGRTVAAGSINFPLRPKH